MNITVASNTNNKENLTFLVLPIVLILGVFAHELIVPPSSLLVEHTVDPLWNFFVYGHIWLNAMVGLAVAWGCKYQFDFFKYHPGLFDALKITLAMVFIGVFKNGLPTSVV